MDDDSIRAMPGDAELDKALNSNDAEEYGDLTIRNQRLARIQEYEESALARPDPLAAVIGIGNADFQRIFESLGTAVLEQINAGSNSIEEFRELGPEIRLLLKMRKAIETDVALQSLEAKKQPTAFPRPRNLKKPEARPSNPFKPGLPKR